MVVFWESGFNLSEACSVKDLRPVVESSELVADQDGESVKSDSQERDDEPASVMMIVVGERV